MKQSRGTRLVTVTRHSPNDRAQRRIQYLISLVTHFTRVIHRKLATHYRALLREVTYKDRALLREVTYEDKASYGSW